MISNNFQFYFFYSNNKNLYPNLSKYLKVFYLLIYFLIQMEFMEKNKIHFIFSFHQIYFFEKKMLLIIIKQLIKINNEQ